MKKDKIVLRTVFKIDKAIINPVRDPKTGMLPDCVRPVDSNGNIIYKGDDLETGRIVIPENAKITIEDGTTFDLNNEYDQAVWHSIQNCSLIALSRDQKDSNGNYIIDGGNKRYGSASFYVEVPGKDAEKRVSKKQLLIKALQYVNSDNLNNRKNIAKVLGRNMSRSTDTEVLDYLLSYATNNSEKIIELYESNDLKARLLFIDALNKNIISSVGGVYYYKSNKEPIGLSEESAIEWLLNPSNSRIVEFIYRDTYPNLYPSDAVEAETEVETKSENKSTKNKKKQ